jgi:hypothetical protein
MFKLTQLFKTHRFSALALSVTLLGVLAGVVVGWSGKAQKQKQEIASPASPTVTSRISAVRVVSAEPTSVGSSNVLVVKLQNTSDKDIKAYTISSGKALMTTNYFLMEESFAAGSTIDLIIPISSGADYKVPMNGKDVTVAAVFFADGTGDGVTPLVTSMADVYAGTRDQAKRILPCLEKSTLTSESLSVCEAEARDLPVKMNGKSSDYESGLEFTKIGLLSRLDQIKENANLSEASEQQEKVTRIFRALTDGSKSNK